MKLGYMKGFKVQLLKADQEVKETYTDAEFQLLLKKPNVNRYSFAEYRAWVIVSYLLGAGNRIRVVAEIQIKDLDLENNLVTLRKTKSRKQQIIPILSSLGPPLKSI